MVANVSCIVQRTPLHACANCTSAVLRANVCRAVCQVEPSSCGLPAAGGRINLQASGLCKSSRQCFMPDCANSCKRHVGYDQQQQRFDSRSSSPAHEACLPACRSPSLVQFMKSGSVVDAVCPGMTYKVYVRDTTEHRHQLGCMQQHQHVPACAALPHDDKAVIVSGQVVTGSIMLHASCG